MTFEQLGLKPDLCRALLDLGFEKPTPIQERVIPELLNSGRDVIGLAQTGTGKTAAFGLPLLEMIDTENRSVQAIVLCPTRELCLQITSEMEKYAKYSPEARILAVYGGAHIVPQIKALQEGAHIVVGTPGRVIDLIQRNRLQLGKIRFLVLDEADEMLNMGFKEDLDTILKQVPEERTTLLFSATMPTEISNMAKKYMDKPIEISTGKANVSAENVDHFYYQVQGRDKYQALKRIADMDPEMYGIVFCRTRQETKDITQQLIEDGYNADALHGDLSQAQRDVVMSRFRVRGLQLLVATDVAARGLDVKELTHVIHYSMPDDLEVYIHRSGRTGRAGQSGISLAIVTSREVFRLRAIEGKIGKKIIRKMVPNGPEICKKRLFNWINRLEHVEMDHEQVDGLLPEVLSKLEWISKEDLIKHMVSLEFNKYLAYYKGSRDLNQVEKTLKRDRNERSERSFDRGDRNERSDRRSDRYSERSFDRGNDRYDRSERGGDHGSFKTGDSNYRKKGRPVPFKRLMINLGADDKMTAKKLIGIINDNVNNRGIEIGRIDILKSFTFVDVDANYEDEVMKGLRKVQYKGTPLKVSPASATA